MKEYFRGDLKFIIEKDEKGLYSYKSQEYSKICNVWVNISKEKNFNKEALENYLNIKIDF